jgi:broad specificity phosphatase PhoE
MDQGLRWYLVRHGVTAWNRLLRFQGHTDIPLDDEGRDQARRIGQRLALSARPPQVVWTSDLSRARETGEAIAEPFGIEVRTTPLLREMMMGEWEGLTRAEIEARGESAELERYFRDRMTQRPPGGEAMQDAWQRLGDAAALIREEHPAGQVAIVGHGLTLRFLLCEALGAELATFSRLYLDNASLSVIDHTGPPGERTTRVRLINDTSHLATRPHWDAQAAGTSPDP